MLLLCDLSTFEQKRPPKRKEKGKKQENAYEKQGNV
jgi:hypothetical protein